MTEKTLALVGNPNSGKTALFNALTGSRQKVANYSGVTVERKEGQLQRPGGKNFRIIDLPGTYSLNPRSPDEWVTRNVLENQNQEVGRPDLLVAVVDATQLERSLNFVLELRNLGQPLLVVLNMADLAQSRGQVLDLPRLSQELRLPVVSAVAIRRKGTEEILRYLDQADWQALQKISPAPRLESAIERFAEVDRVLAMALKKRKTADHWTRRLDAVVLHPLWGTLVFITLLTLLFQAVYYWSAVPMDFISGSIASFGQWLGNLLGEGALKSLIVGGVIEGVGGVLVFIPQILLLFFFILLMEDSGYMARVAFVMDKIMGKVGLHGRAFIPLLSSFACAIPGIMATRTIENPRDRLTTILVAPLMTCSARLPVYTLLIAAFIPNEPVWGPLRSQGLVLMALYFGGIFSALFIAWVLKRGVIRGKNPPLFLELPTYKVPSWRNLLMGLYERARLFIRRAGGIILVSTILLWFLASYPKPSVEEAQNPQFSVVENSYAGRMGKAIEPWIAPLGFDWRIGMALVPGMAAREVMVSALATTYAIEAAENSTEPEQEVEAALSTLIKNQWSLATAISLLVWYIFAPMCLSTLAVTRRESNSWKWPLFMASYMFVLAYGASWLTYQILT